MAFPPPYDERVPRAVDRASKELSPEGADVLERVMATANRQGNMAEIVPALAALPQQDKNVLATVMGVLAEANRAAEADAAGHQDLMEQAMAMVRRAQELDTELAARGNNVTVAQAAAVLERHGEPAGISDEVLEMEVEVPIEDEES